METNVNFKVKHIEPARKEGCVVVIVQFNGSSKEFTYVRKAYNNTTVIEGVDCCFHNSLYQIDKDRVIVGGDNSFSIVNIDKCIIEKRIEGESLGGVYCFLKLRDNKTILCGCDNGKFCFYDMNTKQYKITKNNHNDDINDLLLIDDNTFLCLSDITIKVWKY